MRRFTFVWTPDDVYHPGAFPVTVKCVLFVESGEVATDYQSEGLNIGITSWRSIDSMYYELNEFGTCSDIQWIDGEAKP